MITIMMVLILFDIFLPAVLPGKGADFSQFSKEIRQFENEISMADSLEKEEQANFRRSNFKNRPSPESFGSKSSFEKPRDGLVLDLNSADTFELQQLRGIGPAFARRIVKYRERLGGYIEKSQVIEVFGMDTARYNAIKEQLRVDPDSVRKINLNTVTFKELLFHPYFPFGITKNIMLYKKEHKYFHNVDELLNVTNINDSIFRKMKPYVRIE